MDTTLYNNPREAIKQFSEITDTFAEIIDLGDTKIYRGLLILSSLDEDVQLQFTNAEQGNPEMTVQSQTTLAFDDFRHNDVIKIKYTGSAPTSGKFQMISLRAE